MNGLARGLWRREVRVEHPGRITPVAARVVQRLLAPVVRRMFGPAISGIEHLPPSGPFLLVANHSAGMGLAEILSFAVLYLEHVGPERPLAGFALPTDFVVWPLSAVARSVGAIPSTYDAAAQTLAAGVPILMFPGGDHEALRPIAEAHRVDFGGRSGFVRIARAARVPIVPMGICGSHYTAPILLRSRALAAVLVQPRLIGVKRWGISVLGLLGAALIWAAVPMSWPVRAALSWWWLGTPLVFLPWLPWPIRMRIGEPISPDTLFGPPGTAETEARLHTAQARVQAAVQALVTD